MVASFPSLVVQLGQIFYHVVLPVLLLASIGWILQRRFTLRMDTLTRLNFFFIIPAMVYYSVLTSTLTLGTAMIVVGFALLLMACLGVISYLLAWMKGIPADQRRVMVMTSIFYNAGNFSLPLQKLAFQPMGRGMEAMMYQVFVMIAQNFTTFTIGIFVVAGGKKDRHWKENLLHIAKFPPIYALTAALITIAIRHGIGPENAEQTAKMLSPFWQVIVSIKDAFIPLALLTLGAQLGLVVKDRQKYPVTWSVVLRLLVGPAVALGLIYLLGLQGFLAQVLLISASAPTAVNCMLLCLEFDNHPDYAAQAVFYSTLLSPITVTLIVFLAQGNLLSVFQ